MILVTGGCGFIGRALVRRLAECGEQVRVLDDLSRGQHAEGMINGDVRHSHTVVRAARGCSEIIHLASINGTDSFYQRPGDVLDIALKGISNVVDAARVHGVSRMTLASSSVVYGHAAEMAEDAPLSVPDAFNPFWSYGAGKIASEMFAIHSGAFEHVQIFRPFNVYGPGMQLGHVVPDFVAQMRVKMGLSGLIDFEIIGDPAAARSFCYIDDLVDGIMIIREKGDAGIYNIGTPVVTTVGELAHEIASLFGRKIRLKTAREHKGNVQYRKPDIKKLMALGFQPKVDLRSGLQRILEEDHGMSGLRGAA